MIAYLLKVAIIQSIALLAYYLLFDREPLGQLKRGYLLLAPLLSFVLPLLVIWEVVLPAAPALMAAPQSAAPETPGSAATGGGVGWWIIGLIYCTGLIWQFTTIIRSLIGVKRQLSEATGIEYYNGAYWVCLPTEGTLHTFAQWIFVPRNTHLTPAMREHELVHVRQWHTADRLYITLLRAVCWYNPVMWAYERAIIHNHELIADRRAVARAGLSITAYRRELLAGLTPPPAPLCSGLPFSFTKKRFVMLSTTASPLRTAAKSCLLLGLWIGLLFGFGNTVYSQTTPASPDRAAPAAPPPPPADIPPPPPPLPPPPGWTGTTDTEQMDELTRARFELALHQSRGESKVTAGELAAWQDPREYGVWIDGTLVLNDRLGELSPDDIHHYFSSRLMKNAANYGQYTYQLDITTREHYNAQTRQLEERISALE
jgi:hypothetical protein